MWQWRGGVVSEPSRGDAAGAAADGERGGVRRQKHDGNAPPSRRRGRAELVCEHSGAGAASREQQQQTGSDGRGGRPVHHLMKRRRVQCAVLEVCGQLSCVKQLVHMTQLSQAHRDFKERSVGLAVAHPWASASSPISLRSPSDDAAACRSLALAASRPRLLAAQLRSPPSTPPRPSRASRRRRRAGVFWPLEFNQALSSRKDHSSDSHSDHMPPSSD